MKVKRLVGLRRVTRSFRKEICMWAWSSSMPLCQAKPGCRSMNMAFMRWPLWRLSSSAMASAMFEGPKPMPIRSWVCMGSPTGVVGVWDPQGFTEEALAQQHGQHRALVRKIEGLEVRIAAQSQALEH